VVHSVITAEGTALY